MRASTLALAGLLCAACGTEPAPPPPPLAGKIVFASDRATLDGNPLLYLMNPDGSGVQKVPIPLPGPLSYPDVSPDGRRIAFSRDGEYTVAASGSDLRHLRLSGQGGAGRWSPSGDSLVFGATGTGGSLDVFLMDANGNVLADLTPTANIDEAPGDWSPAGGLIAYTVRPTDGSVPIQVWVANADGTNPRPLVHDAINDAVRPAISPDGTQIAYASGPGYLSELRVIRSDGTGDHLVFDAAPSSVDDPSWSPDGKQIAFAYGLAIAVINPDGTGLRVLADSGVNSFPAWGPAVK